MKELIIVLAICIAYLPLSAFILRKHFGKSILATVGFWISVAIIFDCLLYYYVGKLGLINLTWAIPLSTGIVVVIFEIIKRMVKAPLDSTVLNIRDMSAGKLNITVRE